MERAHSCGYDYLQSAGTAPRWRGRPGPPGPGQSRACGGGSGDRTRWHGGGRGPGRERSRPCPGTGVAAAEERGGRRAQRQRLRGHGGRRRRHAAVTGTGQGPLGAASPGGGGALEVTKPWQETSPPSRSWRPLPQAPLLARVPSASSQNQGRVTDRNKAGAVSMAAADPVFIHSGEKLQDVPFLEAQVPISSARVVTQRPDCPAPQRPSGTRLPGDPEDPQRLPQHSGGGNWVEPGTSFSGRGAT